jgi:hypothetical protein
MSQLRSLHFHGGKIWTYHVGKDYINLWTPTGMRYNLAVHHVLNISAAELERSQWKRTYRGVGPHHVKDFIYRMGWEPTPIP